MFWLLALIAITAGEYIIVGMLPPGIDQATTEARNRATWEIALGAKYLSMAVVLTMLLGEVGKRPLLYRSLIALFCIGAWVDFVGHSAWSVYALDSTIPIMVGWSLWLICTLRRQYSAQGDTVHWDYIFILIHKPKSTWGVIKSLVGFPADSIFLCANGQAWSFRRKSGVFSLYLCGPKIANDHIAINTGKRLTTDIEEMLDDLVGTSRFPGTKCIWSIRHVLRKIGGKFAPRWCDYIPGIYAAKLLRGRK